MQFALLRIAVRLGYPTVRHLLEQFDITSPELNELLALERLDPPMGVRSDHHLAVLASVVANSRMASKGSKTYRPKDFWPEWGSRKPMTPAQILAQFDAMSR